MSVQNNKKSLPRRTWRKYNRKVQPTPGVVLKPNVVVPKKRRFRNVVRLKVLPKSSIVAKAGISGGKGDTRNAVNDVSSVIPSTVQPAITVEVPLDPMVLYGTCLAYVDGAVARGYQTSADSVNYPYWASVYMLNVLLSYTKASAPGAISLPYWLQCLGQALSPKSVPFEQGTIFYRFVSPDLPIPYVPAPGVPIGSVSYGYQHLLYVEGSTNVDMFKVAVPPASYTDALGAVAWASVAQYMSIPGIKCTEVVPLTTTAWSKNVSAFAMPTTPEGLGFGTSGGQVFTAALEVPLYTPQLAVFANSLAYESISYTRFPKKSVTSGGDPMYISSMFAGLGRKKDIMSDRNPRFHFVDFNELGDVLAIYVSYLQKTALEDDTYLKTVSNVGAQCPITLQEMLLILRNEVCYMWGRSQVATQAIYPRAPANDSANEFVPFIQGTNLVALGSCGMMLPILLLENIKSLIYRHVEEKSKSNPCTYCPVVGIYAFDVLSPDPYTYVYNYQLPIPISSFVADPPTVRRMVSKAGTVSWEPETEAAISLIDGTSGSSYYFINSPTRLKQLATLWNEWITRLETYSVTLVKANRDIGVNICSSVGMTRHWVPLGSSLKSMREDVRDLRLEKRKYLTDTIYANRQAIVLTSHDRLVSPVLDQIQSAWVLPTNMSAVGESPADQSFYQRYQIINGEPGTMSMAGDQNGLPMSTLHATFAQMMVHGPNATMTEVEKFFVDAAANGEGGILSGLVANFIGKAFGPTAGSVADEVSHFLPI